ncbi:hypothetical protein FRC12_012105 [Ceratobasidium sp. 428]|nr:hypothetical protein FRC12_012105 [Ceratobasidium sp. 428]
MKTDFRCRQALVAARMELLHEIKKDQCNVLLVEGWKLTKLRRGHEMRIRVHYHGRPARATGNMRHRYPPFMEILEVD